MWSLSLALGLLACRSPAPPPPEHIELGAELPGAWPSTVDEQLAAPLFAELAGLPGLAHAWSVAERGEVRLVLEVADADAAMAAGIEALADWQGPPGAPPPTLRRVPARERVLVAPLARAEVLARALRESPGVSAVEVFGVPEERLRLGLDARRLDAFGVDLLAIERAVREAAPATVEELAAVRVGGSSLGDLGAISAVAARELAITDAGGSPVAALRVGFDDAEAEAEALELARASWALATDTVRVASHPGAVSGVPVLLTATGRDHAITHVSAAAVDALAGQPMLAVHTPREARRWAVADDHAEAARCAGLLAASGEGVRHAGHSPAFFLEATHVAPDRDKIAAAGISVVDVARTVALGRGQPIDGQPPVVLGLGDEARAALRIGERPLADLVTVHAEREHARWRVDGRPAAIAWAALAETGEVAWTVPSEAGCAFPEAPVPPGIGALGE